MAERDKIVKGMAEELWRRANGWSRRQPYAVDIPDAAFKAATDLARLYTDANESLPAMMKAFNKAMAKEDDVTYPAHSFGVLVAQAALGTYVHASLDEMFVIPTFSVEYRKRINDLTWTGDVPEQELVIAGSRVNPKGPKDFTLHPTGAFEGKEAHDFESTPHTKTVAEVRQLLGRRAKKCHRDCPGWAVFETVRGDEVQVCDECNTLQGKAVRLSDDDVAQLPEAQKALREIGAEHLEQNGRR